MISYQQLPSVEEHVIVNKVASIKPHFRKLSESIQVPLLEQQLKLKSNKSGISSSLEYNCCCINFNKKTSLGKKVKESNIFKVVQFSSSEFDEKAAFQTVRVPQYTAFVTIPGKCLPGKSQKFITAKIQTTTSINQQVRSGAHYATERGKDSQIPTIPTGTTATGLITSGGVAATTRVKVHSKKSTGMGGDNKFSENRLSSLGHRQISILANQQHTFKDKESQLTQNMLSNRKDFQEECLESASNPIISVEHQQVLLEDSDYTRPQRITPPRKSNPDTKISSHNIESREGSNDKLSNQVIPEAYEDENNSSKSSKLVDQKKLNSNNEVDHIDPASSNRNNTNSQNADNSRPESLPNGNLENFKRKSSSKFEFNKDMKDSDEDKDFYSKLDYPLVSQVNNSYQNSMKSEKSNFAKYDAAELQKAKQMERKLILNFDGLKQMQKKMKNGGDTFKLPTNQTMQEIH